MNLYCNSKSLGRLSFSKVISNNYDIYILQLTDVIALTFQPPHCYSTNGNRCFIYRSYKALSYYPMICYSMLTSDNLISPSL